MPSDRRPLLIIDGDNLAHRAYHSTPQTVVGAHGRPINAIVGFFGMLTNLWRAEQPRAIFVGWDTLGANTYRNELWPQYQTGRIFDPEIVEQLNVFPDLCRLCGLGVGKQAGYEADDLMASAAFKEVAGGGTSLILTNDKDSWQLVSESITVLTPQRGTRELARITPDEVVKRLGVPPSLVVDFKALSGDPSDKIPGIKGIGPVTASGLLNRLGSLEAVLEEWGSQSRAEQALLFREVARIQTDANVELPESEPNWQGACEALRAIGADMLAERLEKL